MGDTQEMGDAVVIDVDADDGGIEMRHAARRLRAAVEARGRYQRHRETPGPRPLVGSLHFSGGVAVVDGVDVGLPPWQQYYDDVTGLIGTVTDAQCQAACRYRLQVLEEKYNLYKLSNADIEESVDPLRRGGGVFSHATVVDNFPHPWQLSPYVHSERGVQKYMEGLEGSARPVMERNESRTKHVQCTEYSVAVTGLENGEWASIARWMKRSRLLGFKRNSWMVAVVRGSDRRDVDFESYQRQFSNLFLPLFEATLSPDGDEMRRELAAFLQNVGGFVVSSNEVSREAEFSAGLPPPEGMEWRKPVCDLYFAYYLWANVVTLNEVRRRLGLNTFQIRAAAGDGCSHLDTLVYSYLLGDAIAHGLALEDTPVLQYLYGYHRIGVCMSPLSNNAQQTPYMANPLPAFFRRGLCVALCTDHPLLFHDTSDPLIEEYSTASRMYRLTGIDMCELAYNSVVISSFPNGVRYEWLSGSVAQGLVSRETLLQPTTVSMAHTNLPSSRVRFRAEMWRNEWNVIERSADGDAPPDHGIYFSRIKINGPRHSTSQESERFLRALELRKRYRPVAAVSAGAARAAPRMKLGVVDGIIVAYEEQLRPRLPTDLQLPAAFRRDIATLRGIVGDAQVRAFSERRLNVLEHKFRLHLAVNHSREAGAFEGKASRNRDFYQATKVDTNVRMESGMTARQLLNFIIDKASRGGDDIVDQSKEKVPQTLRQLLRDEGIDPTHLTVDQLNVQVDTGLSEASQHFTPEGQGRPLLKLVLKTVNPMNGRYFAELIKQTFENFKRDRFTFAENRLPIYGESMEEWNMLSRWFDTHGMASQNNQWMIQIPRIYGHLRRQNKVPSFAAYLENIFRPLWSASLNPSDNPSLFHFVNHISGFDCVEDERKVDMPLPQTEIPPHEWVSTDDPPYNYYLYYIWANLFTLNRFRWSCALSTFSFRPSCGEDGSLDHLMGGFLLADGISYGVRLKDSPSLQYLFYLAQIGVAVSPLSNNTKVLDYLDNPFLHFFRRGLNVSLSTDGPLLFHHTQEPLIEEYSIASKVWKLSPTDMCEIARNSVKQSGFDREFKEAHLGANYHLSSAVSNDESKTHLSDIRVAYRWETYHTEISMLEEGGLVFPRAMLTLEEESQLALLTSTTNTVQEAPVMFLRDIQEELPADPFEVTLRKQIDELHSSIAAMNQINRALSMELQKVEARNANALADTYSLSYGSISMLRRRQSSIRFVTEDPDRFSLPPIAAPRVQTLDATTAARFKISACLQQLRDLERLLEQQESLPPSQRTARRSISYI